MTKMRADQAAGLRNMAGSGDGTKAMLQTIAVTSGKGGVGKTNVVANLAIAMARLGKRVLVMDADLSLANLDILLGLAPEHHIGHVLSGERRVSEVLIDGPAGIKILPAASGWQELSLLTDPQKLILLDQMDSLDEEFDVFLIDTSAGIGNNVLYFNLAAQERVVIVTPEPTSLTDAYALIKVLFIQHQEKYYRILINDARSEKEAKAVFGQLSAAADRFLSSVSLDYLGMIPHDSSIPKAVRQQQAVVVAFPDSVSSKSFFKLAKQLIEDQTKSGLEGNIRFFWKRLFAIQGQNVG